jgi:hypothetical protein
MLLLSGVAQPMKTPASAVHDEATHGLTPKPLAVLPSSKFITAEVYGTQFKVMLC